MALTRSLHRLDLATIQQTVGESLERDGLLALSQRKLNALGLPLAYIDRQQRYRFVNRAFCDWTAKRAEDVVGREVVEVIGRDVYALYEAYIEAALAGERTGFERQLVVAGPADDLDPRRLLPGTQRAGPGARLPGDVQRRRPSEVARARGGAARAPAAAGHRQRRLADSLLRPAAQGPLRQQAVREQRRRARPRTCSAASVREVLTPDAFAEMQGYIERAFAGATVAWERRDRRQGGEPRWTRVTLFPDREPSGRIGGAFAVLTDIEDDVLVREALKSQQAQLRLFADNIPGPIAYLDRALKYNFVNQAFANWVRRPQGEIYGRTPFDVLPADVAAFLRPILGRAQEGENVEYERIGAMPDGSRRWMHGRVAPDLDAGGRVRGLYCTEYDIHDLKLTEQALAAREEQLRLFTDNIPEPVVYLDDERRYTFVNEAFIELTGLSRERVIGTPSSHDGEDGPLTVDSYVQRALAGESVTYERPAVDAQGRPRWLRARIVPDFRFDGTIKGVYVVGHDITDLKQVQDALAARESQLRVIMDGVPAPVAYIDRDEHCHYVNRTFLQYFGLTAEQVAELRLRDIVGHGIYQSAQAMLARALEGESTAFDRLVPGAGGVRRWMTIRVVPDTGPSGEVARRVRADERHPRPQAGAGSAARVGGRAAADHGQRAGARRLHRRRVPLPLRQSPRRGVDGGEPPGGDRAAGRRDDGAAAIRAARAAARARARRRDGRHRIAAAAAERRAALGADPLRAEPRHRRQGHRHLRGAHRHPRGEAQRGSAAPRQLDAVLAHQQHAAGGAGVGSRISGSSAGRRRRRTSSAGAPTRCWGCRCPAIR